MVEQANKQTAWNKAFGNMMNNINYDLDCNFLATVISYDSSAHTADIKPLNNQSDGSEQAQLLDVPVNKLLYVYDEWLAKVAGNLDVDPPDAVMKKGAIVGVNVLDHDTDDWDGTNATYTPTSKRQHDVNDSVIVGVF